MLHHLRGTVTELLPGSAVIECGGVGFELNITAYTAARLKAGEEAVLYVREQIREDAFDLCGFAGIDERRCFDMLISVSGVGPKAALAILSAVSPEALAMAVISGDERALTAAQGVGKKIAQRILLELKDKMSRDGGEFTGMSPALAAAPAEGASKLNDAASALAVLGYGSAEISAALKGIDIENNSLEEIIRLSLKHMIK